MDIEQQLGYLTAKSENAENQIKTLYEKQHATHTMVTEIHTMLGSSIKSTESQHAAMKAEMDDMQQDMEYCKAGTSEFYQIRRFVMWIGAGFAFLWSSIYKAIDKLFLG